MSLQKLLAGNLNYLSADGIYAAIREETAISGQKPYAVIVTCSDSRVPPEHIFSAGLGELFVIRTAGNAVGDFERGTVEYAVGHLGIKLVMVMGHTHCGAVDAAMHTHGEHPPASLGKLVKEIADAIGGERDATAAAKLNVRHSVSRLLESKLLKDLTEARELTIVPALYDILSGKVEIITN
ncbi:MAG: carbonic anhydrase [Oscillospiraceae bacterium]|jgi:carbonic anhydrase|nr:carbonic anhydrase [Oscillospiraceae bacterium]